MNSKETKKMIADMKAWSKKVCATPASARKDADACFCRDLELSDETRQDLEDAKAGRVNYTANKNTDELFNRLGV